jgi:hypothetical protein
MKNTDYNLAKICIIAYDHLIEAVEKGHPEDANQILSAIGILEFENMEYQIQLVLNSDKQSWLSQDEIGFCASKSIGFNNEREYDA